MKVFKYEIGVPGSSNILALNLPKDAEFLSVQVQDNKPFIWALVDPEAPLKQRNLLVAPTGVEVGDGNFLGKFLGTFQLRPKPQSDVTYDVYIPPDQRGPSTLVFHVFEVP